MLRWKCRLGLPILAAVFTLLAVETVLAGAVPTYRFFGNQNIPPMIFTEDSKAQGLVVDMVTELERRTGLKIDLRAMDWKTAQEMVRAGDGDALVQINRNPEREAYLDFSEPLIVSEFSIFRASGAVEIQNINQLKDRTVGVEAAGYPRSLLARYPDINVKIVEDWKSGFDLVLSGEIDAVVVDRWVGEYVLARNGITGIAVVRKPIETLSSHIAVRKGLDDLLARINDGLRAMEDDGTKDAILEEWSGSEVIYISVYEKQILQIASAALVVFVLASIALIVSNLQRKRALAALYAERASLEARVEERTRELKDQTEAAQAANQAKSEFMASVSHELRTPLNAVIGFAEMLELSIGEKADMDRIKLYAANIGTSGRALLGLINDVLDSAKIEAGKLDLNDEAFRLDREITGVQAAFGYKAGENDVRLELDMVDVDKTVSGDPLRFRQVLFNLLDNAIKFSPGGTVRMTATTEPVDGSRVKVAVAINDTGIGIAEREVSHIFEPFSQSDSSIVRQFGGTGLGLPISRQLSRMMGGDVSAVSTPGEGSTFTATFVFEDISPVENSLAAMHLRQDMENRCPELGLSVLAVDDNETNLAVVETMLASIGCETQTASTGLEALDCIRAHRPDVVLMDLHMPGLSGVDAARKIQELGGQEAEVPIFAWTADGDHEPLLSESGVTWAGTLLKPTTRTSLMSALRQAAA